MTSLFRNIFISVFCLSSICSSSCPPVDTLSSPVTADDSLEIISVSSFQKNLKFSLIHVRNRKLGVELRGVLFN